MVDLIAIRVPGNLPPNVFERVLSHLDESSQARIRKFRLQGDAIRSLFGRISIIYHLLSNNIVPRSSLPNIKFGEEGNGKPIVVEPHLEPRVEYNISHDNDYVLLAVSRKGKTGVDIMKIPPNPADIEEALTDQMTISERQAMALPLSPRQKAERLTMLWCVKEAYVKAIGEGVGFGMERIQVNLTAECNIKGVEVDGKPLREIGWEVEIGVLEGEYIWACVSESSEHEIQGRAISSIISYQEVIDVLQP